MAPAASTSVTQPLTFGPNVDPARQLATGPASAIGAAGIGVASAGGEANRLQQVAAATRLAADLAALDDPDATPADARDTTPGAATSAVAWPAHPAGRHGLA